LSQRQAVLVLYAVSVVLGLVALWSNTAVKLLALGVLLVVSALGIAGLVLVIRRRAHSA
jgi:hypothetical protein